MKIISVILYVIVGFLIASTIQSIHIQEKLEVIEHISLNKEKNAFYRGCRVYGGMDECKEKADIFIKDSQEIFQKVDEINNK